MNEKACKILLKVISKSMKIEVRGGSGRLWGAPWEHLGAKMAPKIAKSSPKRRQEAQHGVKMGQHGSKKGSQICSKIFKNRFKEHIFL